MHDVVVQHEHRCCDHQCMQQASPNRAYSQPGPAGHRICCRMHSDQLVHAEKFICLALINAIQLCTKYGLMHEL